jgi:regulator of protease activity HflC (stomatin/prohibitin superfamily)
MKNQERGKHVAIGGLALQAVLTIAAVILWRMTSAGSLQVTFWLLLGTLPIWAMTVLLFYARQLEAREIMEQEELAASGRDTGLFDEGEQQGLSPAAQRVRFLQRWIVPFVTLLVASYAALISLWLLRSAGGESPAVERTGQAAALAVVCGFGAFLLSRYATGMSRRREWLLLRAPGSYLLMGSIFLGANLVSLLFAGQGNVVLEDILRMILPLVLLVVSAELVINFILNFYRPRMPGDAYTPLYESRLLCLLAEPQRVGHSIADTLNYQFGFEVSRTWFYQLISRAFIPLAVFAVVVLMGMSCFVLVSDGQTCVAKTWGRLPADGALLGPGLHLKWPWPISTAEPFDTGQTHEIVLGLGDQHEPQFTRSGEELILWTEEHGMNARKEQDFLIGTPPRKQKDSDAPPVSIIKLVVLVRYQVKDVFEYGYEYTNVQLLLKSMAENEMIKYVSTATLDTRLPGQSDRPQAIMTTGRGEAARVLQENIQARADQSDLGVKITYVGIVSAHPPNDVVPQYEKVLETERLQDQQRYQAQAEASRLLAAVSGDPLEAMQLYLDMRQAEFFEQLHKDTDRPEKLSTTLAEEIRAVTAQVQSLQAEQDREKLLGRDETSLAGLQNLQAGYQNYLARLTAAQKSPDQTDYLALAESARRNVTRRFDLLQGTPAEQIAQARADRWKRELREQTAVETYRRKLKPYLAAPRVYMFDAYLDVLDATLPQMRKYVLGIDPNRLDLRLNVPERANVLETGLEAAAENQ